MIRLYGKIFTFAVISILSPFLLNGMEILNVHDKEFHTNEEYEAIQKLPTQLKKNLAENSERFRFKVFYYDKELKEQEEAIIREHKAQQFRKSFKLIGLRGFQGSLGGMILYSGCSMLASKTIDTDSMIYSGLFGLGTGITVGIGESIQQTMIALPPKFDYPKFRRMPLIPEEKN